MQLRVFADERAELHLEVSSPSLVYDRRLFVPMVPSGASVLAGVDSKTLVEPTFEAQSYQVPYMFVHSERLGGMRWRELGLIAEEDWRNVLNHILDILAWD